MSDQPRTDDLGRLLQTLRSTIRDAGASAAEPATGTGTAAGGMIEVVAVTGGQIERVTLDPRVMRLPSETLAEQLRDAVNEALGSLRATAASTAGTVPALDPQALTARLEALQDTSVQQMRSFVEAMTRAQRQTGGHRDARP